MRRLAFLFLFVGLGLSRPALAAEQLIINGGFEGTSAAPWVISGTSGAQVVSGPPQSVVAPYDGTHYLTMGNNYAAAQTVSQTVTFPTNMIAATLNFAFYIASQNPLGDDTLNVNLVTPGGTVGLDTATSQTTSSGWTFTTNSFIPYPGGNVISGLSGQTVSLNFAVVTDLIYGGATSFNIDDVALTVATTADIPSNDNFTNAFVIPAAGGTYAETTTYSSKETGEPNIGNNAGGHSVWFTWTAPSLGTVTIATTGSSFNTLLGLYTGSSVNSLTVISNSNGINRSSGLAFITAPVTAGTQYYIGLDGYNGQSGSGFLILNFSKDSTPPTVSVTSPASGALVTSPTVLVKGTAHDNVGVAAVYYQLINAAVTNDWQLATGTTSWSATVTNLIPGKNTVRAQAFDTSTNASAIASSVINYAIPVPLTLVIVGGGIVTGATNGKALNLGFPYTLTAVAKPGFKFAGWSGDIMTATAAVHFNMVSNLSLTATFVDVQKPTLSITAPKPNQKWSNNVINVTGTAKDNLGVASVWVQANGGAWTSSVNSANGFANWNVNVGLNPGANTIKAYAKDAAGNISTTNSVNFTYVLSAPLIVQITGNGTVKQNYNNELLQISNTYSMTATALSGYVFSNWTTTFGAVITNGPTLKFVMESNLDFVANFVPNPFLAAAGMYQGLFFDTNGVTQAGSGFFSAQVTTAGSFTASFKQGNSSHAISGRFSPAGEWSTNAVKTWGNTAISLTLDLPGGNTISGGLTNAAWSAQLQSDRAVFSKSHPSPQSGKYTVVLPGVPPEFESATQPGGSGFGTVVVTSAGGVTLSGTLGDGTKITSTANESAQGQVPLYVSLYGGNGMLLGWLTFTNEPDRDINGILNWFKPAQATSTVYKTGFTNLSQLIVGSAYAFSSGSRVVNLTDGHVVLGGAGLSQSISNQFTLSSKNVVTGSDKLHLTFTTATGLFQGTTTNAQGKTVSFSGAVLQKQTNGFGQFVNGAQTGSVSISPQ